MQQITQILFENDVNILGSVNNDSAEYGIVRMVVSDPDKAEQALQAAGYMTRQTDVLGVEVVDQPGNLNSLLKTLLETNIDIDYIYLFSTASPAARSWCFMYRMYTRQKQA